MKTKKLLTLSIFALLLGLTSNLSEKVTANAEEPTMGKEVIYEYDFEKFDVGTNADTIYADGMLWTESSHVNATVIDVNNDKMYKYEVTGDDGYSYTRFGGFGIDTLGYLEQLKDGVSYTVSIYIEIVKMSENSKLYFEYSTNVYTGVEILANGTVNALNNGTTIKNMSYVDNVLTYTFTANKVSASENSYFKMVGQNMSNGDCLIFDDFKIEKDRANVVLSNNFDGYEIGAASTGSTSDIANVWNDGQPHANFDTLAIAEENNNKYLHAYEAGDGSQKWTNFYFNGLPLINGTKYRISFDFISHNFIEFYAVYNQSGADGVYTATYRPTGVVTVDNEKIAGTFDGNHFTFEFTADTAFGTFWNQVHFITYHTENLELKIDNFKLEKISVDVPTLDANAKQQYFIGEDFVLENVILNYSENDSRVLKENEYILDASLVNKDEVGTYQVNISAVNEFGVAVNDTIEVTYIEDYPTSIAVASNPTKVEYKYGEELDITGLTLNSVMASGKTSPIEVTADMVSGYNKNTIGNQTITVKYEDKETTFDVIVIDYADSLIVKTNPEKVEYKYGEDLDLNGLVLSSVMASGASNDVEVNSSMISGYDKYSLGNQTITVTYGGKNITFEVTVVDIAQSISVSSNPTKVSYEKGDTISLEGLKINITTLSGNAYELSVTEDMISGFDSSKLGEQIITISYEGYETTFIVVINDKVDNTPSDQPSETPSTPDSSDNNSNEPNDSQQSNSGCKGSTTTSLISLIVIAGALLLKKIK